VLAMVLNYHSHSGVTSKQNRQMKYLALFIFLISSEFLLAQDEVSVFDNQIKLEEGVYTSLSEILENSPKYYDCRFEYKVDYWFGKTSIYYFDKTGTRHEFNDTILLIVEDGVRYVNFKNHFCKLILTGAISTFYIENTYLYANGQNLVDTRLYFWDVLTGLINKLNRNTIDEVLQRDNFIYSTYSGISDSKKEKTLYSYILKYNSRNPILIRKQ